MTSTLDGQLWWRDESPVTIQVLSHCIYMHSNGELILKPPGTQVPHPEEFQVHGGFVVQWWSDGYEWDKFVQEVELHFDDHYAYAETIAYWSMRIIKEKGT